MYLVRPATRNDCNDVFRYTRILMLDHHEDDVFIMTHEKLLKDFDDGLFEAFVLTDSSCGDEIKGILIYDPHLRSKFGRGIYLDIYYMSAELRGKGLGGLLIEKLFETTLEKNLSFTKLTFQGGRGLDNLYEKIGFINESKEASSVTHIFELTWIHYEEMFSAHLSPDKCTSTVQSILSNNDAKFPMELVMLTNYDLDPGEEQHLSWMQQMTYCSWVGRVLILTEFGGNPKLLTAQLLRENLERWMDCYHDINSIWLDIPGVLLPAFRDLLSELSFEDITQQEQWNRASIDYLGMFRKLACRKPQNLT